jgi:hypothetical protein
MEDQQAPAPLPLAVLIVGLVIALGCAIWTGSLFFFEGRSILFGVASGISVGAAYAFAAQIKSRLYP